jgi:hypothetical protein
MALRFPDKDPDEKLDYTVDWSRYLNGEVTISSVTWKIQKADGTAVTFSTGYSFQNDGLISAAAAATANVNGATSASNSVSVDEISGTILVNHFVTGTGVTPNTYVTAVNGSTITLSNAVSLSNDTPLTFTVIGLTAANNSQTNTSTTATIVLEKGGPNTTYKLLCEITTTTSARTSAPIITNRKIVIKIRERV